MKYSISAGAKQAFKNENYPSCEQVLWDLSPLFSKG
jgi:hypothetical protein